PRRFRSICTPTSFLPRKNVGEDEGGGCTFCRARLFSVNFFFSSCSSCPSCEYSSMARAGHSSASPLECFDNNSGCLRSPYREGNDIPPSLEVQATERQRL